MPDRERIILVHRLGGSEIDQLQVAIPIQDQVLWLQVPVHHLQQGNLMRLGAVIRMPAWMSLQSEYHARSGVSHASWKAFWGSKRWFSMVGREVR